MTTNITNVQELKNAARFFEQAIVATRPQWVREARLMLGLRIEGNSLGRIATTLSVNLGTHYNAQTIKNRLDWALEIYRQRSSESATGSVCQNCGESHLFPK